MHFLVRIAAVFVGLSFWIGGITDPDLGWHLLGGAWISAHRAVPEQDFINLFNERWHDYHWLAQIIFHRIYVAGGFPALQIFFGLLMAALLSLVLDLTLGQLGARASSLLSFVVVIVASEVLSPVCSVRPQMI